MKTFLYTALSFLLFTTLTFSQNDILGKIKDKAEDKANQKTDEAIDEGMNEVEEGLKNKDEEQKSEEKEVQEDQETQEEKVTGQNEVKQEKKAGLKTYSKYDFIAGEKTVYFDDFNQDNIGDFPVKWNTNSGGEVVEIEGLGKWFHPNWGGTYYPEGMPELPENFTFEFDVIYDFGEADGGPEITLDFISTIPDEPMDNLVPGNGGFEVSFSGYGMRVKNWLNQNYGEIENDKPTDMLFKKSGTPVRFSMMVQKQRVRIWLDQTKLFDIPRLLPAGVKIDRIRIYEWAADEEPVAFYIKNFRVAAGVPDMRNKLLTEGKLVTHGIYFDTGSDKIKPESYGTLKEIANVLKENADVKVKIIGHTDNDGTDASNLDLSKKRSVSVKNVLNTEFGIDVTRMETDGLGESQPMDVNTTPEGKANNRRVEFVKI